MDDLSKERSRDAALIDRFRRGDSSAFDDIVREHRREVYVVARRFLGSHEDADEAAQETFLRAWRGLRGFRGDSALRTWLIRIVLNVARSMRARSRDSLGLAAAAEKPAPGPGPDHRLGGAELRARVRGAVETLPPRQREVVVLKVFTGMTYRDVARAMDLSEGAVKAHFHQAVSNLRRRMA